MPKFIPQKYGDSFIVLAWSLSRGIAHPERRLETKKFNIPTAIRSDGKEDEGAPNHEVVAAE
jgi:hypothetical protein